MGATPKYAFPYPDAGDPANVPGDMEDLADAIDAVIATADVGPLAGRPVSTPGSPGKEGRFYYASDNRQLYLDTGTAWITVQDGDIGKRDRISLSANATVADNIAGTVIPFDSADENQLAGNVSGGEIGSLSRTGIYLIEGLVHTGVNATAVVTQTVQVRRNGPGGHGLWSFPYRTFAANQDGFIRWCFTKQLDFGDSLDVVIYLDPQPSVLIIGGSGAWEDHVSYLQTTFLGNQGATIGI